MKPTELLADMYDQQLQLMKMTLGDFTDAEMLVRPCEGANHAAWQLGHLITSEAQLINMATPGAIPEQPAAFVERHGPKGTQLIDGFDSKDRLLELLTQIRETSVKWVEGLSDADMDRPMPKALEGFAPTVG